MAFREPPLKLLKHVSRSIGCSAGPRIGIAVRNASTTTIQDPVADLESSPTYTAPLPDGEVITSFDPVARAEARKQELPPSRYQFRSPKYDRGPLHPHRPPPSSDPSSREFVPGPFTLPRLSQTYDSTLAPDIMTMTYMHVPPGYKPPSKPPRLRPWDDSSPYHKNRPLRGPRGGDVLRLLRKPITFKTIPRFERVTVHSFVKGATKGSEWLHVAGMAIQAITNVRVQTFKAKNGVAGWGLVKGKQTIAVTAELTGEDMQHFLSKLVDVVLPKIKVWSGVKGSSGDGSGNITFGLDPEVVSVFPEIEVNYDMYPPKMIPGCHITIHTSATTDKDARLLLTSIGIPFYGKLVN